MIFTFLTLLQSAGAPANVSATIAQTLSGISQSAVAKTGSTATISQTLSSHSQAVTAELRPIADIAQTLSSVTQSIDAAIPLEATIDQNLSAIVQGMSGLVALPVEGFIRHTLSGVFQNVTGQLRIFKPVVPKEQKPNFEESILTVTVKEMYRDRTGFDLIQKLANHLKIEVDLNQLSGVVQITREGFLDEFFGRYALKENGSGALIGLIKSVNGVMRPISPGIPNEIRILEGEAGVELVPPKGWEIIDDVAIQSRYNIGNSPNWRIAAIRYIGI